MYCLGIDLGGSGIKVGVLSTEGEVLLRRSLEFDASGHMDWAKKIRDLIERIEEEQGTPAKSIGLAAPGLVADDGLSIVNMPGRLQGLERLNWTQFLGRAEPVPIMNDAQAALIGECWLGAARGFRNVFMLTLGTGVGGAAMVDGRLLRGELGRAGHFGHTCLDINGAPDICGTPGSLELAIGNCTIRERSAGRFESTHELIEAYRSGDKDASEVWLKSVRALACGIVSSINVLDPAAVIIGGGIARAEDALFEPLRQMIRELEWRPTEREVEIIPAQLGELAGACGAARHAMVQLGRERL